MGPRASAASAESVPLPGVFASGNSDDSIGVLVRRVASVMLSREEVVELVDRALLEDVRFGDVTTEWTVSPTKQARADFISRAEGVVAGLDVARWVFERVDTTVVFESLVADGDRVLPGDRLAQVSGSGTGRIS